MRKSNETRRAKDPSADEAAGTTTPMRNADRTRKKILESAYREFAKAGFSGARIKRIVAGAKCNPRMLYHYFGKKESLYVAVLQHAYKDIRAQEQDHHLEELDPLEGMIQLLEITFHHFANNPKFVSLLNYENLMKGRYVLSSKHITEMASPLHHAIQTLLKYGSKKGVFRPDIEPVQIYVTIAALSWFHLSNAYTLSAMFDTDLSRPKWRKARLEHVRQVLEAFLLSNPRDGRARTSSKTSARRPLRRASRKP